MRDRKLGSLIGLAVGDAKGAPYEFLRPQDYEVPYNYETGGCHDVKIGEYTDDTSMALCLAKSLTECKGFDSHDQMKKYVDWYLNGYMSSRGHCFDIGNTTRNVLTTYNATGLLKRGTGDQYSAGNGTIMRLAPLSMVLGQKIHESGKRYAWESSKLTHKSNDAAICAELLDNILTKCYYMDDKEKILSDNIYQNYSKTVINMYDRVINGSATVIPTGYCVSTLEVALDGFIRFDDFDSGLNYVISLGDDTDTVGAVYGQIAGAYYGLSGIGNYYKENLMHYEKILKIGERLLDTFEE